MKSNLQFDFLVDKEKNTLTIVREFNAEQQIVWECYTKSELLEQWFAPKPWYAKTKTMDFKNGGFWLYAMCGPNGEEHWGKMQYENINPIESYEGLDVFCDENGTLNSELPSQYWNVTFHSNDENTLVKTIITYDSLTDLEAILKMGMKEGLTLAYTGLDDLLLTLTK